MIFTYTPNTFVSMCINLFNSDCQDEHIHYLLVRIIELWLKACSARFSLYLIQAPFSLSFRIQKIIFMWYLTTLKTQNPRNGWNYKQYYKTGGQIILTYSTHIFNNILKTKQIPDSWHEAKLVILFKKGDHKNIKNYRPISLLSHCYKIFTRLLQTKRTRRFLKRLFYNRPPASSKPNNKKVKWI